MLSLVSKELLDDDADDDSDIDVGMDSLAGDDAPPGPVWKAKRTLRR